MLAANISLLVFFLVVSDAAKLPANWKKCPKYKNEECLKVVVKQAILDLKDGNKDIGMIPLEPLRFTRLELNQGSNSPVAINLTFYDLDIFGLSRFKINKAKIDWDNYYAELDVDMEDGPALLYGDYTIDGKVMVLPIFGKGKANLTMENFGAFVNLTGSELVKNNKKYFHVDSCKFNVRTTRSHLILGNLFDGVPNLGDNMNKFLDDNWKEVIGELNGTISKAIGLGLTQITNNFFKRFPVTSLYT